MKKCPNPDCLSQQQNRTFFDDDTICPRCGEVLVNPSVGSNATPYPAYTGTPRPAQTISHASAMVGAVLTLLLVFLIIGALRGINLIHTRPTNAIGNMSIPTTGTGSGLNADLPTSVVLGMAQTTATARAQATFAAQPTPIGGFSGGTGANGTGANTTGQPPLPAFPTPRGGTGIGGSTGSNTGTGSNGNPPNTGAGSGISGANPANGSMAVNTSLCRRIEAGQLCEDTQGVYGTRDTFYVGVQASFGDGAARAIRVRLYGPPNGETLLLNQDQTTTPGRSGRFWVGFAFSQNTAWIPGIYRADIFVDNETTRRATTSWVVR